MGLKHVAISLHDMYAGNTMLYLVPRLGDDTLMSFVCVLYCICTSNGSYNGWNYLLVILLIEIDIRRRAEDALKEEVYS